MKILYTVNDAVKQNKYMISIFCKHVLNHYNYDNKIFNVLLNCSHCKNNNCVYVGYFYDKDLTPDKIVAGQ